jgi:alpha-glucosidase
MVKGTLGGAPYGGMGLSLARVVMVVVIWCGIYVQCAGAAGSPNCLVETKYRKDCGDTGAGGVNNERCLSAGCCWSRSPDLNTSWCYQAADSFDVGYFVDAPSLLETDNSITATLKRKLPTTTVFGDDINTLSFQLHYETPSRMRVRITDGENQRWEIPQSVVSRPTDDRVSSKQSDFSVSIQHDPFSIEVKRKSDGMLLFKSAEQLVFKNQYIELTAEFANQLNSDLRVSTYGIGENARTNHKLTTNNTFTLWAADVPSMWKNFNLYSSYPFYLQKIDGAINTHGVLMMNSNGMDVTLLDSSLTYRMIGGIIDLYVFSGPTPVDVVQQYTTLVGRPAMMPYWTLGFHNCRYGYENIEQVRDVVKNYSLAGIPLDTQWIDIDYMAGYRDFTFDAVDFPVAEVQKFVEELHGNGQRFVPIIDPGIMVKKGYEAYEEGIEQGLFVKDVTGG